MKEKVRFLGMDVHAETIAVAVAEQDGEVRSLGTIANRAESVRKLVKKLGPAEHLRACYEAGPTGYVLYWQLAELGVRCEVIAPTLAPMKAGDRVKTDRRDAERLARSYRSGDLTPVWVPDEGSEALRDLVRAREAAKQDQLRARHRLNKFLLRTGQRSAAGVKAWTLAYMAWVRQLRFQQVARESTRLDYLHEVEHMAERVKRLEQAIAEAVKLASPALQEVVRGLQALRGVAQISAVTIAAELGNISRFASARQLMGYSGTVPSENSSGARTQRGSITKTGNAHPRAIQPQSLFASQQFATAVYQSELMYRLRQLGYEITPGRSGAPEIKGYTQEYLDASSPRSQQIREFLERTGRSGKEAAEIAAHSTRDRKEIHSPREVMAAHRKLAADFGHQADTVVRAARERSQQQTQSTRPEPRVRESLTFSRDKNFEREAVIDERALVRDALRRGMGDVTYPQVRANLNARLASGEFQIVERPQSVPGRQFTTAKTIEAEHEIVRRMREGQSQLQPVMTRQEAIQVADQHAHLNRAQKSVVEDVLSSPDRVHGIQGVAGAGKTTTLAVLRGAAEAQGYEVTGFAPTSRAARQLNEAGIEGGTLQGFLARSIKPEMQDVKHFYFVDESSLASTNQMREFLARLGPNDRVLLIGDTRQHQGVEAGRPFEQLQEAGMRTAKLDEIILQKDPALKSTVELLATGQISAALDALQQKGRVKEIPNAEERIRAIAKSYVEAPEKTLIVSPDNASRRELNLAVRQELKANGTLASDDHTLRVLIQRQDMTGAERSWASRYEINNVVRYARGSKSVGIEAGEYGTVVGINSAANVLTIEKSMGQIVTYDPRRLTGVSVYREVERAFSVGDRIQFTAPDKSLGVANRDLARIESISPDGRLSARLDNNRRVEFDANEHRHFDHGYAVTSHSAQGLTAERVLIHADTGVHPDLLNSRFGYVSISRASHEATLFTNDMTKLGPQLSAVISKTSALEINQAPSVSPVIGMGL